MSYLVDTHILLWRLLEPRRLPKACRRAFANDAHEFLIPTIVLLEMQYLTEIGRVEINVDYVLQTIHDESAFQLVPYDEIVMAHSLRLTSTRDPFDRIILAHALATSTRLLTKDRWMRKMAPHLVVA